MSSSDHGLERPSKRVRLSDFPKSDEPSPTSVILAKADPQEGNERDRGSSGGGTNEIERERRVGIAAFATPNEGGFTGTFKQRYTDFLVNEILLSGEVLHFKNTENVPGSVVTAHGSGNDSTKQIDPGLNTAPFQSHSDAVSVETNNINTKAHGATESSGTEEGDVSSDLGMIAEEDKLLLQELFGELTTAAILRLHHQVLRNPSRKAREFTPVLSQVIDDKEKRTKAHGAIRRIFNSKLETVTEGDGHIVVRPVPPKERTSKKQAQKTTRNQFHGTLAWNELGGDYLHFTLFKENKDTMEVINFLGSQLKSHAKNFGFAGTKDRRGVTAQRVCVKRIPAETMKKLGEKLRGSKIGDFSYHRQPLKLGDLLGNEFVISLRDCHFIGEEGLDCIRKLELAEQSVSKAVKDFSENGFINYFGLQRFGSFAASTDRIGMKLLQDDLAGAVDSILEFHPDTLSAALNSSSAALISADDKARAEALHIWKTTNDSHTALDKIPRKFSAESSIIRHLGHKDRRTGEMNRKADFQGALMGMARNMRLMYVHAYQSLVWNFAASERIRLYGLKAVEGDLVLISEHEQRNGAYSTDEVDQAGEVIVLPAIDDSSTTATNAHERARALSADEAASGRYSVFDIVLPQPGWDVEYPKNAIGEFYETFMASDEGGGLDPHNMRRKWREISLSGGYRKLMGRPLRQMSWKVRSYRRADEQLAETDLDRLNGSKEGGAREATEQVEEQKEEEERIAVTLSMQLGSSQYATMALRELMKGGGLVQFQPEFGVGR